MSRLLSMRAARGPQTPPVVDYATMPTGDLPGLHQVYAEDFGTAFGIGAFAPDSNGLILSSAAAYSRYGSKIKFYPDGNNDTHGITKAYASKCVSTSNSCLDVWLHTESVAGVPTPMASWNRPLLPSGLATQKYGRWQYRMSCDVAPGFGTVALLINDATETPQSWPASGEWDWPEGDNTTNLKGFYHYADSAGGQIPVNLPGTNWQTPHTFTMDWTPGQAVWSVDGSQVLSTTDRTPPSALKFIIQSGGSDYATGTPPDPGVSGHLKIDWITIYTAV